jgi:hypothetical protein
VQIRGYHAARDGFVELVNRRGEQRLAAADDVPQPPRAFVSAQHMQEHVEVRGHKEQESARRHG